jgi:hypothetical protein
MTTVTTSGAGGNRGIVGEFRDVTSRKKKTFARPR